MADGIYIKCGRKTYRVVSGNCTKRTCSLFKAGVCDYNGDDYRQLPCDYIHYITNVNGGCLPMDANFKEVK